MTVNNMTIIWHLKNLSWSQRRRIFVGNLKFKDSGMHRIVIINERASVVWSDWQPSVITCIQTNFHTPPTWRYLKVQTGPQVFQGPVKMPKSRDNKEKYFPGEREGASSVIHSITFLSPSVFAINTSSDTTYYNNIHIGFLGTLYVMVCWYISSRAPF